MNILEIAIPAAVAAAALLGLLGGLALRRRGSGDMTAAMAELNARMDTLARDLAGALERAQEEGRRSRILGELAGTIDLDEVLTRTLEAAGAVPGVDAAVISVDTPDGTPITSTMGLGDADPTRLAAGPPDGRVPRTTRFDFAYSTDEPAGDGGLIHSGAAVPLLSEGDHLGYLAAYSRTPGAYLEDEQVRELEELALRAGPAIENARRFREARQLADLDALTGLHNRRYFHETLAREVARAHRYNRELALIVFDLDDFKAINDRIGHLAGDAVLAEAAERVRDVVRSADVACRVGGDEFAVILPESGLADADALYKRLQVAVSARPVAQAGRLNLSAGVTDLRADDDAVSFFQRADQALYRAKDAGKGTVVAAGDNPGHGGPWPRPAPESASNNG